MNQAAQSIETQVSDQADGAGHTQISDHTGMPLLQFNNLTLGYERHPVIHHLDAQIYAGQMLAIVGANGTGKSTLLKAIMGQLKPLDGEVLYPGVHQKTIAYLPQVANLDLSFPITVQEMVSAGLWLRSGAFGSLKTLFARGAVKNALQKVGLQGLEQRTLNALSGGQLQRVLFARMLLQNAELILLDEPFTGVDHTTTQHLLSLLHELNQQGKTVLAVLHDPALVQAHFPQTLLLTRQQTVLGPSQRVITEHYMTQSPLVGSAGQSSFQPTGTEAFNEKAAICTETASRTVILEDKHG